MSQEMSVKSVTLAIAAVFLLVAAVLENAGPLYFMAAAIIAVAIVARLAVWASLRGLRLQRNITDRVFEGERVSVSLNLSNPSRLPKFFLTLEENLSPWLEPERARFFLPVLWPGEAVQLQYHCRPTKRGRLKVGPLSVNTSDPVGLLSRSKTLADGSVAVIYPRPIEVPPHDLEGAVSFGGGMAERTARAGEGLDFHRVRDYHPGDELRRIHWKALARHQRLAVIEFQQSYSADIAIALDLLRGTDVGEGKQTTLEYGVKIAASLARRALDNSACVTLALQGASGPRIVTCRREEEFYRILELLAEAEAAGETPIYSVVEAMRPQLSPGTAAVVITADSDPHLAGLASLLSADNISLSAVLLEASTFLGPPKEAEKGALESDDRSLFSWLRRAREWLFSEDPDLPFPFPLEPSKMPPPLRRIWGWFFESLEEKPQEAAVSASPVGAAESATKSDTAAAYFSLAESLRLSGAKAYVVGREDDLVAAVRRIMGGAE